jgi:hypothetical protein
MSLRAGLIELAGYEMPDGRLLVQPRVLARTANMERAVVRVEGPGVDLAAILTPEEAARRGVVDEVSDEDGEVGARRSFDPVVLEADRRWRVEFIKRLRLDDPAQAVGRVGFGRVFLDLPVPWAWMTAYVSRRNNTCGNTLVLRGDAGAEIFRALKAETQEIETELLATGDSKAIDWKEREDQWWVEVWRQFSVGWTLEQESVRLEWLLAATNGFVNTFRPRVLRLLHRSEP